MHAVRGGWLGQTFALAKYDDSFEGKKSGIRRSKEERKGMVETFIKRYQKSNNGDFPSLNLTRKEVGGSFYTVREIVREIIQENRVLGPPKSPPGDQNMDNLDSFLEHSPLGSLSVDVHAHSVPLNDTQTLCEFEVLSEKALNTIATNGLHQEIVDSGNVIGEDKDTGSNVVETTCATVSNGPLEKQKNEDLSIEGGTGKQKDEINEVETKIVKNSEDISVTSAVHKDVKTEEKNGENRELETGNNRHLDDVNDSTHVETGDTLPVEDKTVNGSNFHSNPSFNSVQHRTLDDKSPSSNKSFDQPCDSSQNRRTNPTLNRINLESWKAASQKSYGRETHQIVKFIKSFITAFVKFWTE